MANENICQLKITLTGIRPSIWRRILIPRDWNFNSLHHAIQDAMGWRNCHLYFFKGLNQTKGVKETIDPHYDVDDGVSDKSEKIRDYFQKPKDKVIYEYDMGNGWEHSITLEKLLPEDASVKYPKCLSGKRACPPENSGGIDEYKSLLEILSDPEHEEYASCSSWFENCGYPTPIDPEYFDTNNVYKDWESKRGQDAAN